MLIQMWGLISNIVDYVNQIKRKPKRSDCVPSFDIPLTSFNKETNTNAQKQNFYKYKDAVIPILHTK